MKDNPLGFHEDGSYLHGYQTVHLKVATWIRERRCALGMTQKQMAEKAGVSQQLYQYFESGKRSLMSSSFKTTCKILEALEYDIVEFYHNGFAFGERIYIDKDGIERFERNGQNVEDDPDLSEQSSQGEEQKY